MRFEQRRRLLIVSLCLFLAFASTASSVVQGQGRAASRVSRPQIKLVVGLMIDQFRADYLVRFRDQFVSGGLERLLDGGAVFANAHYIHVPTYTACGHATFMSGASPSLNGIIGNEWFDRTLNKRVTSVSDDSVKLLTGASSDAAGASPSKLLGSTLGDELRLASEGESKVVGIAFKDRSAILPAGKRPNGAYWFDNKSGGFVSSTYYFSELPEWVRKFNRDVRAERYFGKKWERLLPEAAYSRSRPDNAPEEKSIFGTTFPYTINGGENAVGPRFYAQFEMTPFGNEFAIEFARAAIENEALGADSIPDLLTLSLSANDLLGHTYGPYSQEVQDMVLRTDRMLADFFTYLDRKVGMNNVVIALSADHGVAPIPEMIAEQGFGGRIGARVVPTAVTAALTSQFGSGEWIRQYVNGNVYLDETIIETKKLDKKAVELAACAAAITVRGIGSCYTRSDLIAGSLPQDRVARAVASGFYAARNGNIIAVPEPFWFVAEGIATTHGGPYSYDTHVPVILYGPGFIAGRYTEESSPADIAPTLAALLNLTPPSNYVGRVLSEALAKRPLR
ncbi:MAG: alkaline phosphatase family protein [Acidobacteriota bacterium]